MAPPAKRSFMLAVDNFVPTQHKSVTPAIDPSTVSLPEPFVALVLGASEGIGAAIACAYAKANASTIIISSRSASKLAAVESEIKSINPKTQVQIIACDVTSSDSVAELASKITSDYGRLDACVSAFGYASPIYLKATRSKPADVAQCFNVNVLGLYHAAHSLLPLMLTETSPPSAKAFLTVGSVAGSILTGPIANFGYCASKMAQARLIESFAEQYREQGLLAVSVHPGSVPTPNAGANMPKPMQSFLKDDPALTGGACVWLSKGRRTEGEDDKQWLTGRLISATWDYDELAAKKEAVVEGDLLTWRMAT